LLQEVERRRKSPEFKARLTRIIERTGSCSRPGQVTVEYPELSDYIAVASAVTGLSLVSYWPA